MKTSNLLFKICLFASVLFQVACSYTNIKACRVPILVIPGEIFFGLFHQEPEDVTDEFLPETIEDPLSRSVAMEETKAVRCLLKKGVRDPDYSSVYLRLSMQHGGLEIFKLLIKYDTDVHLKDHQGNTPLHYSFGLGLTGLNTQLSIEDGTIFTKILIENGADPNIKNDYGISPFDIVRERGLLELITLFEETVEATQRTNPIPLNNTPLHSVENIEEAKLLIINGADVNAINRDNQTPLHKAVWRGNIELVKLLLENKVDVNAIENTGGWTPLHIASYKRYEEIVKLLLENKADVNVRDNFGKVALHFVSRNNKEIVKLLIENKAIAYMKDDRGVTPRDILQRGDEEQINFFIKTRREQKEEPNPIPLNNTPLHLVENIEEAKLLIENGADVNAKNRENETPLHKAVWRGNIELVKLLIENGADLNARERKDGWAPLHIASKKRQLEIIKILLDAGADVYITDWSNTFASYYVGSKLSTNSYYIGFEPTRLEIEEEKTRLEAIKKLFKEPRKK